MSLPEWSQDEVNYFVRLYRNHESLWNPHKQSYSNREMRQAAFANIELKMQLMGIFDYGEEQIKKKICDLQAKYIQIQKQYKNCSIVPPEYGETWYLDMDYMVNLSSQYNSSNLPSVKTEPLPSEFNDYSLHEENDKYDDNGSISASSVKIQSRIHIMNVLKKLYISKVTQSYKIVFDILTKVMHYTDRRLIICEESCRREMSKLGYKFKETIDGKKIIIEDVELRFERYLYLSKIKNFRAKQKPMIYVDERVFNKQLKFEKLGLKDDLPPDSCIVFLAITNGGALSYLFSSQATKEDFNKWVTDMLLSRIKIPSVIIMDNSPIHGKLEDTCQITMYSTKNEMLKWLNANNIPCSPNIARPHLFELIRQNRSETKQYKIDRIIRSHGHEVLRLPKTFSDLSMSDIFWPTMTEPKNSKMLREPDSLQMLQITFLEKLLPSIPKTKWFDMEKKLIWTENEVYQSDIAIESVLETYTFM